MNDSNKKFYKSRELMTQIKKRYGLEIDWYFIRSLRQRNKLIDCVCIDGWNYSERDLETIIKEFNYKKQIENLHTCDELIKRLNCTKNMINTMQKNGILRPKYYGKKYYDSNDIQRAYEYLKKNRSGYTVQQLSEKFNITADQVRNLIRKYKIDPFRIYNGVKYFDESILIYFQNAFPFYDKLEDLKSTNTIMKELDININELKKRIALGKVDTYTFGGRRYINKQDYNRIVKTDLHYKSLLYYSEKYQINIDYLRTQIKKVYNDDIVIFRGIKHYDPTKLHTQMQTIKNEYDKKWEEIRAELVIKYPESAGWSYDKTNSFKYSYKEKEYLIKTANISTLPENAIDSKTVMQKYGLSYQELKRRVKLTDITPYTYLGIRYFSEDMCKIITNKNNVYRPFAYYLRKFKLNKKHLIKIAAEGHLGKKIILNGGTYYSPLIAEKYLRKMLKEQQKNPDKNFKVFGKRYIDQYSNILELIDKGLSLFNAKLIESKKIVRDYILMRIRSTREDCRDTKAIGIINVLNRLSYHTDNKEFYDLSEDEIKSLIITNNFTQHSTESITRFLNYVSLQSMNHITVSKDRNKEVKEKYSQEVWLELFKFINDIEIHFNKAIEDELYSKMWLLVMLHMFLTWRLKDFAKFPYPEVNLIGSQFVSDFESEKLTLGDVLVIINDIKEKIEHDNANKNNKKLTFTSPLLHLGLSFGVAVLIAERHRRRSQNPSLLSEKDCKYYQRNIRRCGLFDSFNINDFWFSSLIANRSLATHEVRIAAKMPGKLAVALQLVGHGRSHTFNRDGVPETSIEYVCITSGDGGTFDEIAIALQSRGYGGFLYEEILNIAFGEQIANLNFYEKTDIIKAIRSDITLIEAENITGYILCQNERKKATIDRLKELNADFSSLVKKLINYELPSKQPGIQCLDYCKYPLSKFCTGCENAILPLFALFELKDRLYKVIHDMSKTPKDKSNELKQYSYELLRYVELFNIFYQIYNYVDNGFIKAVFDWKKIKSDVDGLLMSGKLIN